MNRPAVNPRSHFAPPTLAEEPAQMLWRYRQQLRDLSLSEKISRVDAAHNRIDFEQEALKTFLRCTRLKLHLCRHSRLHFHAKHRMYEGSEIWI
jgi:hypothetical protein